MDGHEFEIDLMPEIQRLSDKVATPEIQAALERPEVRLLLTEASAMWGFASLEGDPGLREVFTLMYAAWVQGFDYGRQKQSGR